MAIMQHLTEVVLGHTEILVVEMPPGFNKTTFCVHLFTAWGFAHNRASRFVHTSYSDTLVKDNSIIVKTIMKDPLYRLLFPYRISRLKNTASFWKLTSGGGFRAVSSKGAITGFGAGYAGVEGFCGAILIDDPLKIEDADSYVEREKAKRIVSRTVRSRRRGAHTPIVLFMQRASIDDPAQYVKDGGLGTHKLKILTVTATDSKGKSVYPEVLSQESIESMRKQDPFLWATQYMQKPEKVEGTIFKRSDWRYYTIIPPIQYKVIFMDTAQKDGKSHDYTVMQCWGFHEGKIYLLDMFRDKLLAPELLIQAQAFINKHRGYWKAEAPLRKVFIEDKVSGTGLIQLLGKKGGFPIEGISRTSKNKIERANDVVGYVSAECVFLPEDAPWLCDFLDETSMFPMAPHDDIVDVLCDAIDKMLVQKIKVTPKVFNLRAVGRNR